MAIVVWFAIAATPVLTRFYRDPESSMRWVFEELARLGVTPVGHESEPGAAERPDALRAAVVRRAWTIMQTRGWVPGPEAAPVGDEEARDTKV